MYPRHSSNTRTTMSCVSAAARAAPSWRRAPSAGSGRASRVVRASGGSRGRVTARRARVLTARSPTKISTRKVRRDSDPPHPRRGRPRRAAPRRRAPRASRRISAKRRSSRVSSRAKSSEARPSSRETPSPVHNATSDESDITRPSARTRLTDVPLPVLPVVLVHVVDVGNSRGDLRADPEPEGGQREAQDGSQRHGAGGAAFGAGGA